MDIANPIKEARLREGKTLEEFSTSCGVHLQALYLNERGVYPSVLPAILDYLVKLGLQEDELVTQYLAYQDSKRKLVGQSTDLANYRSPEPRFDEGHPFVSFRESLSGFDLMSRMAFCKNFCVHPAVMYKLEHGTMKHLPEQVVHALRVAGLPDIVIEELNARCEEYVVGGWAERAAS